MIKIYNGKLGFSKMVHVILEEEDGTTETLCGHKSRLITKVDDKEVTCKNCMSDAQLINTLNKEDKDV